MFRLWVFWSVSVLCMSSIAVVGCSVVLDRETNQSIPCVEPADFEQFNVVVQHKMHEGDSLPMDMALVTVQSNLQNPTSLCAQSDECWKCAYVNVGNVPTGKNWTLLVDSRFPVTLIFTWTRVDNSTDTCVIREKLEQHGSYCISLWSVAQDHYSSQLHSKVHCSFATESVSPDSNIPVYVALGIMAGLTALWILLKFLYRKKVFLALRLVPAVDTERLINSDLGTPTTAGPAPPSEDELQEPPKEEPPKRQRLMSLDAFRGFSLIVMIFVNYRGGYYWFFRHSSWNGLTVADLVFPWFVFIMGTSIALAFQGQLRRGIPRRLMLWKIIKRTVILFVLGIVISNGAKGGQAVRPESVRIPGVLQRLALTYCVVALMELVFARTDDPHQGKWWSPVRDVVVFWPEWLISLGLVTIHVCLTLLMPVHGCPTGYLGPGGLHDYAKYANCTGGAAGAIDRWFFKPQHIYPHPTSKVLYLDGTPYDPEGILGTLTSIFICFLGLQAGKTLLLYTTSRQRIIRWIIWSLVTGLIAGILCKFSQDDGWIPVNKNLWSLSFVLAMACMAFFLLTVCYILIDVLKVWSGAPFLYPGMNSILIYMCHELFSSYFPIQFWVEQTHAAQLAMSIWGAAIWVTVSVVLYHKKIFLAI